MRVVAVAALAARIASAGDRFLQAAAQAEEPAKSFLPVAPSDLSIASACSAYPKCVERGLTDGACCPSAGPDGQQLDCCEGGPSACTAFAACVSEGHGSGTCCAAGAELDCCQEKPTACSAYPRCVAAGLTEGACCPSEGIYLDCCRDTDKDTSEPADVSEGSACAAFPACVDLNLTAGACCPTLDNVTLECCYSGQYLPIEDSNEPNSQQEDADASPVQTSPGEI
mmetsp:Transcript_40175/g.94044  ORF Transcript_40175/g.94044 Transcript_40175/m.94044 type:complete len:226 (+) Transcript_40175:87-764(+)